MRSGKLVSLGALLILSATLLLHSVGGSTILQAQRIPALSARSGESPGQPPYEMALVGRKPVQPPLLDFDSLDGWVLECEGGASGELRPSLEQQLWGSPVARLDYQGKSEQSRVTLRPPAAIPVPSAVSAVTLWVCGNNWGWDPDPSTPQVNLTLLLRDSKDRMHRLEMTRVRWKEWWFVHRVLTPEIVSAAPLKFEGIEVSGCANQEIRTLFFENFSFFLEEFPELSFRSRPRRGIELFPGQSSGANTGPGRLPFPTRSTTILPENRTEQFKTEVLFSDSMGRFRFIYQGRDIVIEYCLAPGERFWGPVNVKMNRIPVADALVDAGPVFEPGLRNLRLIRTWKDGDVARAEWKGEADAVEVLIESSIRLWQKSLVVDFTCRGGHAGSLSYGRITGVREPELIPLPYLNYGSHHLNVLAGRGPRPFFASAWMDWYLSNASEPYAKDEMDESGVWLNGGVDYLPKTDGRRNDLFERMFLTFSPVFEEVLPTIPNPPAKEGKIAGQRLWQETWGPSDYEEEMRRSRRLRAYGIEKLTQCNHEITWRDGGESFTFRTMAAPAKGGDEALKRYVAAQKDLSWRSGLYTNYTDYAPVNAYWDVNMVMRKSSGDLVTAWPRCYSPKALFAVEMDRELAPLIRDKFGSNAAYTDVHTAVAPWDRTDYDVRVPGAGTFAATFYAYGELLLHDQDIYDHHCWSEGHHQWLYAGLATGNYALTYSDLKYREYPYLPHFDLLKMHPLSVDIGMPWTAHFFRDSEGWDSPERIVRSIDQFLAATIAYGHIGWLVEENHGIRQTVRSYYMLQQLQSRYAMERPEVILYGAEKGLTDSSTALLEGTWKRSQVYVRYLNGLEVWVNGNADQDWALDLEGESVLLPPHGWLARQGADFFEASSLVNGSRSDRVSSPEYVFLDGRGIAQEFAGIRTAGSVAVRRLERAEGISLIVAEAAPVHLLPLEDEFAYDDVRTLITKTALAESVQAQAFTVDQEPLGEVGLERQDSGWMLRAVPDGVRYDLRIR